MRHDRCSEHAGGEQYGLGSFEAGDQSGDGLAAGDVGEGEPGQEADGDDGQQSHDHELESALSAPTLDRQDDHRHASGDQSAEEERDVEEQVECDGAADDFGDVGRDRHHLGLEPEGAAVVLTQALTQHFGQGSAGDETEFRGQILHEDGHRVGEYEYPDEEVAVLGAGGEVGGDVARIDVRDCRDERRTEQGDGSPRGSSARSRRLLRTGAHRSPGHTYSDLLVRISEL